MNMPVVPACPPAELEARLRLHQLPEVGPRRFHALIDAFGDAASALTAPASAWRALGLPAACAEARRSAEVRDGAAAAMAWLERPGQHLLMWDALRIPRCLLRRTQPRRCSSWPATLHCSSGRSWPSSAVAAQRRLRWTPPRHFPGVLPRPVSPSPAGWLWGRWCRSSGGIAGRWAHHRRARHGSAKTLSTAPSRAGPGHDRRWQCAGVGVSLGCQSACREFSPTQPDHQRSVARSASGRGESGQWFADHRATGGRARPGGVRHSRFDPPPRLQGLPPADPRRCFAG